MSSGHTNVRATDRDGQQLSVSHTTTDSPILPAANLEQLNRIDPSLVQWVVKQTEIESEFRRKETRRVNSFIFAERMSGVLVGGGIAICGLLVAAYVAIAGQPWVAGIIGGTTLVAIVTVIVTRRPEADSEDPPHRSNKNKKK